MTIELRPIPSGGGNSTIKSHISQSLSPVLGHCHLIDESRYMCSKERPFPPEESPERDANFIQRTMNNILFPCFFAPTFFHVLVSHCQSPGTQFIPLLELLSINSQ